LASGGGRSSHGPSGSLGRSTPGLRDKAPAQMLLLPDMETTEDSTVLGRASSLQVRKKPAKKRRGENLKGNEQWIRRWPRPGPGRREGASGLPICILVAVAREITSTTYKQRWIDCTEDCLSAVRAGALQVSLQFAQTSDVLSPSRYGGSWWLQYSRHRQLLYTFGNATRTYVQRSTF
jgi:hypothetical protein